MASWRPLVRERSFAHRNHGISRLGGHVVRADELLDLADRLAECEEDLAVRVLADDAERGRDPHPLLDAARDRLARDLELLSTALERSSMAAD
jgi:hypothetical protein